MTNMIIITLSCTCCQEDTKILLPNLRQTEEMRKNQSKQAITMTPEVKSCSMFLAIKNKENRHEKHKTMINTSADVKCKERLRKPGNKAVSVFSGPFV